MPYMPNMGGVAEWEQKVLTLVRRIEEIIDSTAAPLRIWLTNQMEQMVTDAAPGAVIAGGTMTREEVMMYSAMFQATLTFRQTPIAVYIDSEGQPVMMSPEAITGYRRMTTSLPPPLLGAGTTELLGGVGGVDARPPARLPLSAPDQAAPDQPKDAQ